MLRWNPRRFYPRVDDKLETKRLLREAGIPTPRSLGVITTTAARPATPARRPPAVRPPGAARGAQATASWW
jgi:hypothetical protein